MTYLVEMTEEEAKDMKILISRMRQILSTARPAKAVKNTDFKSNWRGDVSLDDGTPVFLYAAGAEVPERHGIVLHKPLQGNR